MEIVFLSKAKKDWEYWIKTGDKALLKKITEITQDIIKNPFEGLGKPEGLKHKMSGKWSRRITREHRYIYKVRG